MNFERAFAGAVNGVTGPENCWKGENGAPPKAAWRKTESLSIRSKVGYRTVTVHLLYSGSFSGRCILPLFFVALLMFSH